MKLLVVITTGYNEERKSSRTLYITSVDRDVSLYQKRYTDQSSYNESIKIAKGYGGEIYNHPNYNGIVLISHVIDFYN